MVDLGSIMKNVSGNAAGIDQALSALKDCVSYIKNGSNKSESNGLAGKLKSPAIKGDFFYLKIDKKLNLLYSITKQEHYKN